jgi:hypothetical protein
LYFDIRTDIKVEGGSLEIPSVLSKYIKNGDERIDTKSDSNNSGIPGNVVFDYLPLHPALSNPRSNHRYQLSLWKQKSPLQIEKTKWTLKSEQDRILAKSLPPHQRLTESQSELDLEIRSRSVFLPTLQFTTKHNLTLSGLYLFTSTFTIKVPEIYTKLGLHQPVYASFRNLHARHTLRKIDASTLLAKKGLENLDGVEMKKFNHGYKDTLPQPHLPTRRNLRVDTPEIEVYSPSLRKENGRVKRLGVYGAVGLVRSGGDVASGFVGDVRREFEDGRGYVDA